MREISRRAILDAAADVFRAVGPGQATAAEIASRAGVAKGLVFTYFENKDALLEAVIEDRLVTALQYWEDLPPLSGAALLREVANRALDRAVAHPDDFRLYYSLFFQPGAPDAVRRVGERLKPQVQAYYTLLAAALQKAGSTTPAADALLFQAALSGLVQNLIIQPDLARNPTLFPRTPLIERLVAALVPSPRRRVKASRARNGK